ncbi:alkyl hydroperoxide reductase subunit AhpC [Bradyrhizobium sp. JR4.1]
MIGALGTWRLIGWHIACFACAERCFRVMTCEDNMLGIGSKLPSFDITGVKPGFHLQEENGNNAFETLTEQSFPGKWKIIFFYPKDFTFVCPTEIVEFARLSKDFADRDAIVLGGSTDNEFCKLAWRREHKDLHRLAIWQFSDTKGALVDGLGVRSRDGIAHRYTFIIDPENTIQHVYATSLNVGRNPRDTLRVLDAIQTDELCPCNREIGGDTLKIG